MSSDPKKVLLYVFRDSEICFVHVLLNALDMHKKGFIVKIILEGPSCTLPAKLAKPDAKFHKLYLQVKELGLIDCVCKACANLLNASDDCTAENLALKGEMSGHPALSDYILDGYQVITF